MVEFVDALRDAGYVANQILASAQRPLGDIAAFMSTGVTVTNGTAGANSTIQTAATTARNGGVSANLGDGRVTMLGGLAQSTVPNTAEVIYSITLNNNTLWSAHASGIAFITQADTFDFAMRAQNGNAQRWIAYLTDLNTGIRQRIQETDIVVPAGEANNFNYYKIALANTGNTRNMLVEVYCSDHLARFRGVNVPTGCSVRPWVNYEPRVLMIGDSFYQGDGGMNDTTRDARLAMPDWMLATLGIRVPACINGIGGTGLLGKGSGGAFYNYQERQAAGDFTAARIGNVDLIVVNGSNNDLATSPGGTADDTAVTNAMADFISRVMANQPNAIIVALPQPFRPDLVPYSTARANAYRDGVLRAAGSDRRVIWAGGNTIYENGLNTGDIGADANHLGGLYATRRVGVSLGQSIVGAIRGRYGL